MRIFRINYTKFLLEARKRGLFQESEYLKKARKRAKEEQNINPKVVRIKRTKRTA